MNSEDRVLVEILASVDAAWGPLRETDRNSDFANTNLYFAQRDYATEGVPWRSGEAEEVERKRSQRRLEKLAAAELVQVFAAKARTIGVHLTDQGEARARALCDLPGLDESHLGLSVLVGFGKDLWVNEVCLLTGKKNPNYDDPLLGEHPGRMLWLHQATMSPILARAMAHANSDAHGRVYYLATIRGHKWAAEPEPVLSDDLPAVDEEAVTLYADTLASRRVDFQTQIPRNPREIGPCPLPVGCPMIRAANGIDARPPRRRRKRGGRG